MGHEWRVSLYLRLPSLTPACRRFLLIESDAPELTINAVVTSFNDNCENIPVHKQAYLYLSLGVDYARDAYLRLRNYRPRKADPAFRA